MLEPYLDILLNEKKTAFMENSLSKVEGELFSDERVCYRTGFPIRSASLIMLHCKVNTISSFGEFVMRLTYTLLQKRDDCHGQ